MSFLDKLKTTVGKAKDKSDEIVEKNRGRLPDKIERAYDKVSTAAEKVAPGSDGTDKPVAEPVADGTDNPVAHPTPEPAAHPTPEPADDSATRHPDLTPDNPDLMKFRRPYDAETSPRTVGWSSRWCGCRRRRRRVCGRASAAIPGVSLRRAIRACIGVSPTTAIVPAGRSAIGADDRPCPSPDPTAASAAANSATTSACVRLEHHALISASSSIAMFGAARRTRRTVHRRRPRAARARAAATLSLLVDTATHLPSRHW